MNNSTRTQTIIILVQCIKLPDILSAPSFPESFGNQFFHHSYPQVKNLKSAPYPSLVQNILTLKAKLFLPGIEDKQKECLLCFHDLWGKEAKSVYKFKESSAGRVASTTDSDCLQNTL